MSLADPEFSPRPRPRSPAPDAAWRAAPARRNSRSASFTLIRKRCGLHRKQIELRRNLRRPGCDRHREHAAVRGGAGAHARTDESLEYQTATGEVLRSSAVRPTDCSRVRHDCRNRGSTLRGRDSASCCSSDGELHPSWRKLHGPSDLDGSSAGAFRCDPTGSVDRPGDTNRSRSFTSPMSGRSGLRIGELALTAATIGPFWAFHCCGRDNPIGAIIVAATGSRPFTRQADRLVTTFADQAVIAIENTRLFDEVQARNSRPRPRWARSAGQ